MLFHYFGRQTRIYKGYQTIVINIVIESMQVRNKRNIKKHFFSFMIITVRLFCCTFVMVGFVLSFYVVHISFYHEKDMTCT